MDGSGPGGTGTPPPSRTRSDGGTGRRTTRAASRAQTTAIRRRGSRPILHIGEPGRNGWRAVRRAWESVALSFRELAEHAAISLMGTCHDLLQTIIHAAGANGRDNDDVPVRRKLQRGFGLDAELVQQFLVEDEGQAVAGLGKLSPPSGDPFVRRLYLVRTSGASDPGRPESRLASGECRFRHAPGVAAFEPLRSSPGSREPELC